MLIGSNEICTFPLYKYLAQLQIEPTQRQFSFNKKYKSKMCSVNILIEMIGFFTVLLLYKFEKKWKKFLSGQKMVHIFQIWLFSWNKTLSKISLNSFLSPWLIINHAKFWKEWISRFKNSPEKFTARSFTMAKDTGRYNVAILRAWLGIPNKLTERFPDRALHVFIVKNIFKCWHQLLITHP